MDATSYLLGKKAGGGSGTTNYNNLSNKPSINNVELSGNKTTSDLGIVIPTVPTNVSAFTNDAGYTTNTGTITSVKMNGSTVASSGEVDLGTVVTDKSDKQDTLVSGTNIKTINNESILGSGNITISGGGGAEAKVYSYNLEQYKSQYSTDAPSDLVQIMQSAITDFQNGNTVFIEDRVYNDTIKRLFILSGVQNNTAYFTCTGYEMEEVISEQYYNGYVYNKQFCYYIVYGVESHKIRMSQGMEKTISKYLSPVNQSTAFIPTADSHPTSKKYVDKVHYQNMAGYDATKTQVLKNVNGTLTWVTEE